MANGILIVDKPAGWTSQDVVSKLKGVFHTRRIGHGGTLDPMATGVLPVFVGRATRAAEFLSAADKRYLAVLRLGVTTDTQDSTGTVLREQETTVSREELEAALSGFLGEQLQTPPMYSAIKIGGKKLYELARQNKEVARPARRITVHEIKLIGQEQGDWKIEVHCSKGTYVRTLCHDIGQRLGCGGCMSGLRRLRAGAFSIEQAHPLEQILAAEKPEELLLPVDSLFSELPAVRLNEQQTKKCRNGAAFPFDWQGDLCRVYSPEIRVEFYTHLRPERRFPSVEEMKQEILRNAEQTREFFKVHSQI